MGPVIKFPDMRPPRRRDPMREPPPPSEFRRVSPAIIASQPGVQLKRLSRKRLWVWLGVAVALHIAVFIVYWLTPPLRIPWSPAPEDWVPVVSLPPTTDATSAQTPQAPPAQTPEAPSAQTPQAPPAQTPDVSSAPSLLEAKPPAPQPPPGQARGQTTDTRPRPAPHKEPSLVH